MTPGRSGLLSGPDDTRISYRHWQPGDDAQLWPMINSVGWLSEDRYATKFNDLGLMEDSIVVAETDGEIIGHCLTAIRTLIHGEARLRFGNVGQVLVRDQYRGQKIGAELYARTLKFAEDHDISAIWLVAHPGRGPAYEMYLRRGFEVVQGRMAAIGRAEPSPTGLEVRRAQRSETRIIANLRETFAATTSGVEDRNTNVSSGTEWHIVRNGETPVAAAAIRRVDDLQTVASLLYATQNDPTGYLEAVITKLELNSFQLHGSPRGHLVKTTPWLPWEKRSGENLIYIVSLERLFHQLAPFLQARASEIGLGSARLTISTGNERLTIELADEQVGNTDPRPGDTELRFDRGGLASFLFGTRDLGEAVAEGTVTLGAGDLDLHTVSAWLSPFDHCDFTQLAGW